MHSSIQKNRNVKVLYDEIISSDVIKLTGGLSISKYTISIVDKVSAKFLCMYLRIYSKLDFNIQIALSTKGGEIYYIFTHYNQVSSVQSSLYSKIDSNHIKVYPLSFLPSNEWVFISFDILSIFKTIPLTIKSIQILGALFLHHAVACLDINQLNAHYSNFKFKTPQNGTVFPKVFYVPNLTKAVSCSTLVRSLSIQNVLLTPNTNQKYYSFTVKAPGTEPSAKLESSANSAIQPIPNLKADNTIGSAISDVQFTTDSTGKVVFKALNPVVEQELASKREKENQKAVHLEMQQEQDRQHRLFLTLKNNAQPYHRFSADPGILQSAKLPKREHTSDARSDYQSYIAKLQDYISVSPWTYSEPLYLKMINKIIAYNNTINKLTVSTASKPSYQRHKQHAHIEKLNTEKRFLESAIAKKIKNITQDMVSLDHCKDDNRRTYTHQEYLSRIDMAFHMKQQPAVKSYKHGWNVTNSYVKLKSNKSIIPTANVLDQYDISCLSE